MNLSHRIKKIKPSPTLAITQKAGEMKKSGIDVVSFGAGEPDFNTPPEIIASCKNALDEGWTKYTPVAGLPDMKEAIADFIKRRTGIGYKPSQIIATCGAKSAIFMALQALINAGDEVIVPAPYWVSYPDQIFLADGVPVIAETSESTGFKVKPEILGKYISPRTRVLIINSPSNPTGAVYSKDELSKLVDYCASKKIVIIADEIYDRLVYDGAFTSVLSASAAAQENTIYINGVAKTYAMTGWRMGYAAGPVDVIKAMTDYQSQLLTCIPPFVQKASITALNSSDATVNSMVEKFRIRRDLICRLVKDIEGFEFTTPSGAFYLYVNVKKVLGKKSGSSVIKTADDLSEFLLNEAHVATVSGSAFGTEGYLRFSFATSEKNIEKGIARIKEAVATLK